MLFELENYYRKRGILSTSFSCVFKKQCGHTSKNFIGPKSAFVSTGYEDNRLPRLLFISLDPGRVDQDSAERLPIYVRKKEEDGDVLSFPKNRHWYRTHELAWRILEKFKPGLQIQEVKKYFAHTNSAKCCSNKAHNKKGDEILFKNCKRFLKDELKILDPIIIVTQGNEAREAISSFCEKDLISIDKYAFIVHLNGKKIFWLHTYHPSNYGAFNEQRNLWGFYSVEIHKFICNQNWQPSQKKIS